jgi:hypothetical protein
MFTTGRIIFVLVFLGLFITYLVWAYRKDIEKTPWYFKGSLKIALTLFGIYVAYFILTRLLV